MMDEMNKSINRKIYILEKPQFHQFAKISRRESFPIYGNVYAKITYKYKDGWIGNREDV